jgi:hypothetical protein
MALGPLNERSELESLLLSCDIAVDPIIDWDNGEYKLGFYKLTVTQQDNILKIVKDLSLDGQLDCPWRPDGRTVELRKLSFDTAVKFRRAFYKEFPKPTT